MSHEDVETLIIGAGQAGLATAFHLTRGGREVLVVDGDAYAFRHALLGEVDGKPLTFREGCPVSQ